MSKIEKAGKAAATEKAWASSLVERPLGYSSVPYAEYKTSRVYLISCVNGGFNGKELYIITLPLLYHIPYIVLVELILKNDT